MNDDRDDIAPGPGTPVSAFMTRTVLTLDPDATVQEARAFFAHTGLRWAPVADEGGAVLGVVSLADLAAPPVAGEAPAGAAAADGTAAGVLRAWQFCRYRPATVRPETPAIEVAREMARRGLHHVVVADERGLVGVVSSLDFVRAWAEGRPALA